MHAVCVLGSFLALLHSDTRVYLMMHLRVLDRINAKEEGLIWRLCTLPDDVLNYVMLQ